MPATLVSAVNLGRSFVGLERDPQWIPVAKERVRFAQEDLRVEKTKPEKRSSKPTVQEVAPEETALSFEDLMSSMGG